MVAKTYEAWEQAGEPYDAKGNKKLYVDVINPKTKAIKTVRWYNEAEYKRMYPDAVLTEASFNARWAFGFRDAGYITLLRGDDTAIEAWASETFPYRARFNTLFKWFIPSYLEMPPLPPHIKPIVLNWSEIGMDDIHMKEDNVVEQHVQSLYLGENGNFIGVPGGRYSGVLTVVENNEIDNHFNVLHEHIMKDENGNTLIWNTHACDLPVGTVLNISSAKVKAHAVRNGVNQTILNYVRYTIE